MVTAGNSSGATVQCLGSDRSLGTLCAAVTTRADEGSDRYFSLSGVCTVLRSTVYVIPTCWRSKLPHAFCVRVCTWNIQLGLRLDAIVDTVRTRRDFSGLDLLCLQEASLLGARGAGGGRA